jgi:predicted Zn-dependent protease
MACHSEFMHKAFGFSISKTVISILACPLLQGQVPIGKQPAPAHESPIVQTSSDSQGVPRADQQAEEELTQGTALTRQGSFREAIPHLRAARKQVVNEYAANFNLALCYVATREFRLAIEVLHELRGTGQDGVDVENLLAQAYIGNAQPQEALAAVRKGATRSPQNEKLYVFVVDACMDHKDYRLGLEVIDIGLSNLPQSARLHYERAMFLTQLDQPDQAKPQFELVGKLAPGSEIAHMAAAQKELFEGDIPEAIRWAREGVKQGYENPALLTILGEALIRSGVTPGQSEFAEAQTALEKAVTQRPNDPASQIALGSLYLTAGRIDDAITHLEIARQLEPGKSSVYALLARAYRRQGNQQQAQGALNILEGLNREQADHIRSAPGDRKLGYAGRATTEEETVQPHP